MSILGISPQPQARLLLSTRQQQVLDAFEELIKRCGFRHLTVGSIADMLHCSRRTLYELAASKDDLVALAVSRLFDRNMRRGTGGGDASRHCQRCPDPWADPGGVRDRVVERRVAADVANTPGAASCSPPTTRKPSTWCGISSNRA